MLTAEKLRELVYYDSSTGLFYRLKNAKKDRSIPCCAINDKGYISLSVLCRTYRAHRLAILYTTGEWPKGDVDHINGIKSDNRMENLRDCTRTENMRNKGAYASNKSGFKGVHWSYGMKKFCASIRVNGKLICLGFFHDAEDAYKAYCNAAREYFGEFAFHALPKSQPAPQGDE